MTAGEQIAGVATYGRPRTVEYEPAPTVCPACLTDTALSPCPQNCPIREDAQR